ncbi:hypothetical protein ACHQM5_019962 [Ranunculus cassubicifolius]
MAAKYRNETLLQQITKGTAKFELVSPSISTANSNRFSFPILAETSHRFFARIGPSLGGGGGNGDSSAALKKVEHYTVQKVTGDGRCMFRAMVKGMAMNKGVSLGAREERDDADELRMAVKEVICESDKERRQHEEALVAITVDESLKRYCQRIERSDFWGGESELLVLSKMCRQPVVVYIPEKEHAGRGSGFIPIAEYGNEFRKGSKKSKPRQTVKLLYSGKNHYDVLV